MIILVTVLTFLSTLAGGLLALRFKDHLRLTLGFSAGAVIGVSFFDLLPESLALGAPYYPANSIIGMIVLGFIIYMILDRLTWLHFRSHEHAGTFRGQLAAGSLSIHSFFDGVAIGLAFNVSHATGIVVAIAVIAHDFSDGLTTVNVTMKEGTRTDRSFKWLLVDSIAPVLGIASTYLFTLSAQAFALVISLFTGFFLYIGASDLLPESHHQYSSFWTTCMTILGIALMYGAVHLST